MIRVVIFIAIVAVLYYLITRNAYTGNAICERCEGKGYWRGLRGERNNCKACAGTGEISIE